MAGVYSGGWRATAITPAPLAASPVSERTHRSSRHPREIGIDASDHVPRTLDAESLAWADIAVSTCSEEVCPVTPGVQRISWHLPDPKDLALDQVRPIRDEINRLVGDLVAALDRETAQRAS
jgi:protein-tyrosine-phosphatase